MTQATTPPGAGPGVPASTIRDYAAGRGLDAAGLLAMKFSDPDPCQPIAPDPGGPHLITTGDGEGEPDALYAVADLDVLAEALRASEATP